MEVWKAWSHLHKKAGSCSVPKSKSTEIYLLLLQNTQILFLGEPYDQSLEMEYP